MKTFIIIKLRWLTVGLNFETKEIQDKIIEQIKTVWEYYPGDFKILFSGNGCIEHFPTDSILLEKFVALEYLIDYIGCIAEMKEGCFQANLRSREIYEQMMKESPLKKFIFKEQIKKLEEEQQRDKLFVNDLRNLKNELEQL